MPLRETLRHRGQLSTLRIKYRDDLDTNPVVRLLYVVVSLLLQNVCRYLHWEYVATLRQCGRRLWEWSFKKFINMIQREAWTTLAVHQALPSNRPPDDRLPGNHHPDSLQREWRRCRVGGSRRR